jgi:protocatechuate 3,4-dioxygenase beta subunit
LPRGNFTYDRRWHELSAFSSVSSSLRFPTAHLHVKVSAPGHEMLTAQLYFPGDPHNDDDIARAVKPELILHPVKQPGGTTSLSYDFTLDPEQG